MSVDAETNIQVDWEIDTPNVIECDSFSSEPLPPIKNIPKYHEADCLEDEFLSLCKSQNPISSSTNKTVKDALQKSVIGNGFEQLTSVPSYTASRRAVRKYRKKQRDATKGPEWFNLPVPELTEEVKNDITLLRMRSVLNPKSFYKKNDLAHVPKYFQVGTVLETPADFYNGRIPNAQRKRSLVNELMADIESRAYQKKKYKMIVDSSRQKQRKPKENTKRDNVKKTRKNKSKMGQA